MIIRPPIGPSYQQLWWRVLRIKWGENGYRGTLYINIFPLKVPYQDLVFYVARKTGGAVGQVSVVSN